MVKNQVTFFIHYFSIELNRRNVNGLIVLAIVSFRISLRQRENRVLRFWWPSLTGCWDLVFKRSLLVMLSQYGRTCSSNITDYCLRFLGS